MPSRACSIWWATWRMTIASGTVKGCTSRMASTTFSWRALQEKVVDAILDVHPFTVPDAMVMRHVAHQIEQAREGMRAQGVDPGRVPWDYGQLISERRPGAEEGGRRAVPPAAVAGREAEPPPH